MKGKNFAGSMKEFYYNPATPTDQRNEVTEEQRTQLKMLKRLIP